MALIPAVLGVALLPHQEAQPPGRPGWWHTLQQGLQDFLTVERVRDILVVVLAALVYLWMARRGKNELILTPSRVVVAQDLRRMQQLGVTANGLDQLLIDLEVLDIRSDAEQDALLLRGLGMRHALAAEARLKELEALSAAALQAAAVPVKDSLQAPVKAYLDKPTLSAGQCATLRQALAAISHDKAYKSWVENRTALRRQRKAQGLGVAGVLLIVLLVSLFGNPATRLTESARETPVVPHVGMPAKR